MFGTATGFTVSGLAQIVATDDSHMRGTRLSCSHNQNDSRLIARIVSARSFMQPELSGNSTKTSGDEVPCKAASRADAWPGNHATIGRSAFPYSRQNGHVSDSMHQTTLLGTLAGRLPCVGHPHLRSEGHFQHASACPTDASKVLSSLRRRIPPTRAGSFRWPFSRQGGRELHLTRRARGIMLETSATDFGSLWKVP